MPWTPGTAAPNSQPTRRLLVNARNTLSLYTVGASGAAADADVLPTLSVADGDGGVAASGTYSKRAATVGIYDYVLAPLSTLDSFAVTSSATVEGAAESYFTSFATVGGYLFSVAELRAFDDGKYSDATRFPTELLLYARDAAESALRDACHVAFVPEGYREVNDGQGDINQWTSYTRLRRVVGAKIDGVALTSQELADVRAYPEGKLTRQTLGSWGSYLPPAYQGNWYPVLGYLPSKVELWYEHGYDAPPGRVKTAAMILAGEALRSTTIDRRATTFTNQLGTLQFGTVDARHTFGIPEVDAIVAEYTEADDLMIG